MPGVSGIIGRRPELAENPIEPREFKALVHGVAQQLAWKVVETHEPEYAMNNYHVAVLEKWGRQIGFLGHWRDPWVAFAEPYRLGYRFQEFTDVSELAQALEDQSRFRALPAELLSRTPTDDEMQNLPQAEQDSIRAWKASIGEVLFNAWD